MSISNFELVRCHGWFHYISSHNAHSSKKPRRRACGRGGSATSTLSRRSSLHHCWGLNFLNVAADVDGNASISVGKVCAVIRPVLNFFGVYIYYKRVSFPRIPSVRVPGMKSGIAQWTEHASVGPRGIYSHAGQSTTEPRRQYSRSVGTAQYASMIRIPRSWEVLGYARHTNGISGRSNARARRVTLQLRDPVKQ